MLKFNVHTSGLDSLGEKVSSASDKAAHIVAVQVRKDTSPYVPALTGIWTGGLGWMVPELFILGHNLVNLYHGKLMVDPATGSSYAQKGSTKVLTDKNLVFSKAMHGQAQSHWFEASKAENIEKWVRVADKAVKRDL